MDDIGWFAGVDWASEKHRVCLLNASGQAVGERDVDHTGTGLSELCDWLLARTGASPGQIAVAIETPQPAPVTRRDRAAPWPCLRAQGARPDAAWRAQPR